VGKMKEILIDITLDEPKATILEAMEQAGYKYKGIFKYDYPEWGHKYYERIKTELFEKENKLFYFANVPQWKEGNISVIRIGEVENKSNKNPEYIYA